MNFAAIGQADTPGLPILDQQPVNGGAGQDGQVAALAGRGQKGARGRTAAAIAGRGLEKADAILTRAVEIRIGADLGLGPGGHEGLA